MNKYDVMEIAYKRGYDNGYAQAEKDILKSISDFLNKKNWINTNNMNSEKCISQ